MHCYFHVVNGDATINDETGLEVADLDHAREAAIKALVEVRALILRWRTRAPAGG
jgi:hypothetical protein